MRAINYAFWIELNMTLKILTFCISSLQNSWHFVFWILVTPLTSPILFSQSILPYVTEKMLKFMLSN